MSPHADPLVAAEYRRTYYRNRYPWTKAMHAAKYASKKADRYGVQNDNVHWSVFVRLQALPCVYCGADPSGYADHVSPMHQGGANSVANLASACRSCNESKGGRTPEQWASGEIGRRRRTPRTTCRCGHEKVARARGLICLRCHADNERARRAQRQAVSA